MSLFGSSKHIFELENCMKQWRPHVSIFGALFTPKWFRFVYFAMYKQTNGPVNVEFPNDQMDHTSERIKKMIKTNGNN